MKIPRTPIENLYQIGDKINKILKRPRKINGSRIFSIGNLTTGGTGKTPAAAYFANLLQKGGYKVGILTRGYGGTIYKTGGLLTDGDEIYLSEVESGDEPYLLAKNLPGVPIAVGKDRYKNGARLKKDFDIDIFLLDDGFQHYALARDYDLVLVDATKPFGNGHILPLGNLRESPSALQRADAVLLTKCDLVEEDELEKLKEKVMKIMGRDTVFYSSHKPMGLVTIPGEHGDTGGKGAKKRNQMEKLSLLQNESIWALSGIGNHRAFEGTLKKLGAAEVKNISFRDHHRYTQKDIDSIMKRVGPNEVLVTTEKDWIRLQYFKDSLRAFKRFYFLKIELAPEESDLDRLISNVCHKLEVEL